jgi:predicted dehydrogenase
VLVEKPMVTDIADGERLVAEAERRKLTLMVDHTFVYTPAVRRIRNLIVAGELGEILYYDATRINLGLFQQDVDVIWDMAVHDVSILAYLVDDAPIAVSATGKNHVADSPENIAYLTLFFAGNMIAHVDVNWFAPVKIRRTIIGGSRKTLIYDDLEVSEKVKVYDAGLRLQNDPEQVRKMLVGYRIGDMWAPALQSTEALSLVAAHFVDCVRTCRPAETSGQKGLATVRALAAASRSMQLRGRAIDIGTLEPCDGIP